ncbi:MAG: hypothetical protein JXA52_02925 [Planctomycetes bacterium]|nr:hypothetical protein [Planctomycetota bacterium]
MKPDSNQPERKSNTFGYHRPIKPLASWKSHQKIAFTIFLAFFVLGGIVSIFTPPVYRAESLINFPPRRISSLSEQDRIPMDGYDAFAQNQVYHLQRPELLKKALQTLDFQNLEWNHGGDLEESLLVLEEKVTVQRLAGSYLISIAMEDTQPADLAKTVDAIVEVYLREVREGTLTNEDQHKIKLLARKGDLENTLKTLNARIAVLAKELGLLAGEDKLVNPFRNEIEFLSNKLVEARSELIKAQANLATVKAAEEAITPEEILAKAMLLVDDDPELKEQLKFLREREALLETRKFELEQLGEEEISEQIDPLEISDLVRIKVDQHELEQNRKDYVKTREEAITTRAETLSAESKKRITAAATLEKNASETVKRFENQLQQYTADREAFTDKYNEVKQIEKDLQRNHLLLTKVEEQIDIFAEEEVAPGLIQLEQKAQTPTEPVQHYRLKNLGIFTLVGIILALLIPLGIDYFNPWVLGPSDVAPIVHSPPLGWILERKDEKCKLFAREQLRRLARVIDEKRGVEKLKLLAISSARPGGGASELCCLLADEFVNLGLKALVIEANAFRPDNRFTAGHGGPGLIDLLNGEAASEEVIRKSQGGLPDCITVGETKGQRILPEKNIAEVFKKLSGKYDLCLVDTPPALLSADAELLARICDATLLLVETERVTLNEMARAASILNRASQGATQVVLNKVRVFKDGGYFAEMLSEYEDPTRKPPSSFWGDLLLKYHKKF